MVMRERAANALASLDFMKRTMGTIGLGARIMLSGFAAVAPVIVAACSDDPAAPADAGNEAGSAAETGAAESGADTSVADAGNDTATPASDLGPGPYAIAYAGTKLGIDQRTATSATLAAGRMTGYVVNADESLLAGTNQVVDVGGDGPVLWGRWAGGTTAGAYYGNPPFAFAANGGLHYAIGRATTTLPASGNGAYTLAGKTTATVSDGSLAPGSVTGSASAAFAGAGTKVGFSVTLDVPGDASYVITTTGGAADPSTSQVGIFDGHFLATDGSDPITLTTGGACTVAGGAPCIAVFDGFFAGDGAERLAAVIHVFKGSGGDPKTVSAVAIFKK